jgi:hypothetical protein
VQDTTKITLPYLPNIVVTMEYMLRKVPQPRYSGHDVRDARKFLDLAKEAYLEIKREIGPI